MLSATTARFQPRRRSAKWQARPRYLHPDDIGKAMLMLVNLMSEMSALRDRLETVEAVVGLGGHPTSAALDKDKLVQAQRQRAVLRRFQGAEFRGRIERGRFSARDFFRGNREPVYLNGQ